MDDKIYKYKEKAKYLQGNNKKQKRSNKNDINFYKTSSQDRSLKIKQKIFKEDNEFNLGNYKTLNQFRRNKTKGKEMKLNEKILKTNNNIISKRYKNNSKPSKIKQKFLLTEPNKSKESYLKTKNSSNKDYKKNKIFEKKVVDLPLVPSLNIKKNIDNNDNYILFENESEINNEYRKLRKIWEETGVTRTFIKNFQIINNNKISDDNNEGILQIIKAEISV